MRNKYKMADDLDLLGMDTPQNVGLGFIVYDLDGKGHLSEDFLDSPLGKYCEEELRRETRRYNKNY